MISLYTLAMFGKQFTVTKRQLGIVLFAGGLLSTIGITAIDLLAIGREGGIGPTQQIALLGTILLTIIGLSLIPLGNDPA